MTEFAVSDIYPNEPPVPKSYLKVIPIEVRPKILSPRGEECLTLFARGFKSSDIGKKLGISPDTVDNHLDIVRLSLGDIHSTNEAVVVALERGEIDLKKITTLLKEAGP